MLIYLNEFFKEFDFRPEDAAHLLACAQSIADNDGARGLFEQAIAAYEADLNCDYRAIMGQARQAGDAVNVHNYTAELLLFICLSRKLRERYIQHGIDLQIWHDSMLDLRYKLEESLAVLGICGSFVAGWFPGFFNMTRFALGRLQFELADMPNDYHRDGISIAKGQKVINIHIPRSGKPLSKESYEQAFSLAKEFYKDTFPAGPAPFMCHSWLLYPETANFVPQHLNVYKFLSEFHIVESHYNDGEDLWRLFDTMERHPDRLPTDTTLRRAFVAHLQKGGRVGWGFGILFR